MSSTESFSQLISSHCFRLYSLCCFVIDKNNKITVLNRRFLGMLHMEAAWMEETLDSAGAKHNDKWFQFREAVSALKLFSSVIYDLNHVKGSFKSYTLIESENNFPDDANNVLEELYKTIYKSADYLVKKAKKCGLHSGDTSIDADSFTDLSISNCMERNRKLRHIDKPGKTLIYLATEFINLRSEMTIFKSRSSLSKVEYKSYIPNNVSEEKLRLILVRYHNLQSLYDTYLSESDIEDADNRLKTLRGHISFIFHMLKSATEFAHYYERHVIPRKNLFITGFLQPISEDRLLEITIDFFLKYFEYYFYAVKELCFDIIDSYAEICERDISIPPYRGFHVRPSSLVAKIVNYYGGRVKMIVDGVEYDPSTSLELFRVNEAINAIKRKKLFKIVKELELVTENIEDLLAKLEKMEYIVTYKNPIEEIPEKGSMCEHEYLKTVFAYLLASGQIDIKMDLKVKFIGDLRSIGDIEILAQTGYGEDKYGNNIPLPKKLNYLRR